MGQVREYCLVVLDDWSSKDLRLVRGSGLSEEIKEVPQMYVEENFS